jgi:hypothetical protein
MLERAGRQGVDCDGSEFDSRRLVLDWRMHLRISRPTSPALPVGGVAGGRQ